jgi:hypothetical protein
MLSLNQVIMDMRIRFPLLDFYLTSSHNGPTFWWVNIRVIGRNDIYMMVEVDINYDEESVIACVIDNRGFKRKDFTLIMDSFLNSFD